MEVGYLAGFLGGALALLSPCGALLLPAFFASTIGGRGRMLVHGAVFYLGLTVTLVPLGLGAALLGSLVASRRELLVTGAGWTIIVLGLATAAGVGFDLGRLVPGARSRAASTGRAGAYLRTLALGTVSGVAGFCAGPILGAVLTVAATGSPAAGGVTLAFYAAGMVVPLVVLALLWGRMGAEGRAALRGREVRLGPLRTHSTSLLTGAVLVAVGVVFLRTSGMATLPDLVSTEALGRWQNQALSIASGVPDAVLVGTLALLAVTAWWVVQRRAARTPVERSDDASIDPADPVDPAGHR